MAMKETLVCRPCGTRVMVADLGSTVIECYECGIELQPAAKAAKKPAVKKAAVKKPAPKKTAAKKKK